jgi:hypothetical protein
MDLTKVPLNEYGRVQTKGGCPAKVLCIDRKGGARPVLYLYTAVDGSEVLTACDIDGAGPISDFNLIPVPKRVRFKGWLNVFKDGSFNRHHTREDADRIGAQSRIACIEIDREVTEGEGLT